VECPYERREDKSEKRVLKKKSFSKFSKYPKRKDEMALVHEKYMSDNSDEEGGVGENAGTAAIVVHLLQIG
jgi:hypothetical protein